MCNFGNDYMRCKMINTGRLMFDRQLTDAGGGNISVRPVSYTHLDDRHSHDSRHGGGGDDQLCDYGRREKTEICVRGCA